MKRSLLARLRTNGIAYIVGALILLIVSPVYQVFVLSPLGYSTALSASASGHFTIYGEWIHTHVLSFVLFRMQLLLALLLLLSLPFTLFRIIVAQELLAQQEQEDEQLEEPDESDQEQRGDEEQESAEDDGMPPYAWRGKGFAVIAAWSGISGLVVYLLGSLASTGYFLVTAPSVTSGFWYSLFSIVTNTVGIGLLALATLFFGAMVVRSGMRLWPPQWVFFGYTALATAALFSGSAVAIASAPNSQAALTAPAILLFALWVLWLGVMLVRLKPE